MIILLLLFTFCSINSISAQSKFGNHSLMTFKDKGHEIELLEILNDKGNKMYTKYYTTKDGNGNIDTIIYNSYVKKKELLSPFYNGKFISYYLNESVYEEAFSKYFKKYGSRTFVGKYNSYFKNGNKQTEYSYDFWGNPHGEILEYYENGKLKIKTQIETKYDTLPSKDLVSPFITLKEYDSIKVLRENTPIDSIKKNWIFIFITSLSGKYIYFHENGTKMIEGEYSFKEMEKMDNEEFMEKATSFHHKSYKNGYKFDSKNGKWKFWNKRGELVKIEHYKNDSLLKEEVFIKDSFLSQKKLKRGNLYLFTSSEIAGNTVYDFK